MLATIHDDSWNMLNTQHIIPNLERCLKVATTLEKTPTTTHGTQEHNIFR